VILTHNYDFKYKTFRKIISVIIKLFFIDSNSNKELLALKQYILEGKKKKNT
jgi:hypothetical protein